MRVRQPRQRLSFGGWAPGVRVADYVIEVLDAPVRCVGAMDTFVAYAPVLEDAILPQVADVVKAIGELRSY